MENLDLEEKINIILRQTNYTYEEAQYKLKENNNDHIQVIKKYIGINDKKTTTTCKPNSLNQEIYKQLREKMNTGIKDYNTKVQNEKVVLH
jgi:hypothetical protein